MMLYRYVMNDAILYSYVIDDAMLYRYVILIWCILSTGLWWESDIQTYTEEASETGSWYQPTEPWW